MTITRPRPLIFPLLFLIGILAFLNGSVSLQAGMAYHGNTNTFKFHEPSCRYYNCPHCTAVFKTRQEAIDAGYVPCKVCNP